MLNSFCFKVVSHFGLSIFAAEPKEAEEEKSRRGDLTPQVASTAKEIQIKRLETMQV